MSMDSGKGVIDHQKPAKTIKMQDLYKKKQAVSKVNKLTSKDYDFIKLIGFRLGEEEFVIEIDKVKEIGKVPLVTRVSQSPRFVEGIANLRGEILQILNLHKIMGLICKEINERSRIIVLDDTSAFAAIIVDSVSEVLEIDKNTIQRPPEIIAGDKGKFIKGVIKEDKRRSILWLDSSAIYQEFTGAAS